MEQLPPFSQGLVSHSVMIAVSHNSPVYPDGQTQVLLLTQTPLAHGGSQITAISYEHNFNGLISLLSPMCSRHTELCTKLSA